MKKIQEMYGLQGPNGGSYPTPAQVGWYRLLPKLHKHVFVHSDQLTLAEATEKLDGKYVGLMDLYAQAGTLDPQKVEELSTECYIEACTMALQPLSPAKAAQLRKEARGLLHKPQPSETPRPRPANDRIRRLLYKELTGNRSRDGRRLPPRWHQRCNELAHCPGGIIAHDSDSYDIVFKWGGSDPTEARAYWHDGALFIRHWEKFGGGNGMPHTTWYQVREEELAALLESYNEP